MCISLLFSSLSYAQGTKDIAQKKLIKDYKNFISFFEAHPAQYRYIDKEDWIKLVDQQEKLINRDMSSLEFYRIIAPVMASIKDGHSNLSLPDHYLHVAYKEQGVFPFEVHLSDENKLYILENLNQENDIPKGTEITKINGISIDSMVNLLDPLISYERVPFRNVIIENSINEYLLLAFGRLDNIELSYTLGEPKLMTVKNLDKREYKSAKKDIRDSRDKRIAQGRPYEYKKIKDDIGMLSIYSFAAPDFESYKTFLRDAFKKIANDNINYLILDVRGNFGGYPSVSAELFHYVTEMPFATMMLSRTKVSNTFRQYYISRYPGITAYKGPFVRTSAHYLDVDAILKDPIGTYSEEGMRYIEKPKSQNNEFSGTLLLLTDRYSYSAASSFAAAFKCYKMGYIIGTETGGTQVFPASSVSGILLNSKLPIRISTTQNITTCAEEELSGITPDIVFKPSIIDLSNNFDSQLNYTLRVIKQTKKEEAANKED